jgi:hypothetical protein
LNSNEPEKRFVENLTKLALLVTLVSDEGDDVVEVGEGLTMDLKKERKDI